jgi:Glycosyl transferases group 1
MRVGVTLAKVPFLRDRAETRAEELVQALRAAGHEAELISIPFTGRPDCQIAEQMLACRLLDLEESMGTRIDRLIGLTFPAYLVSHSAKVIWLLRQCRAAHDLWGTSYGNLHTTTDGELLRKLICGADTRVMSVARGMFVPSQSAAERLHVDCGVAATPLYVPPAFAVAYRHKDDDDFFLLPAGDDDTLRQDLVLQAVRRTRYSVRLRVLADPSASAVKQLGQGDPSLEGRVVWGRTGSEGRRALFGSCLAVVFASLGEADNMVALEAMLSEKALITCNDSGGVAELVQDGQTGYVCSPDPDALAEALDRLWEDRTLARRLGRSARANYQDLRLSWDRVLEQLLA